MKGGYNWLEMENPPPRVDNESEEVVFRWMCPEGGRLMVMNP